MPIIAGTNRGQIRISILELAEQIEENYNYDLEIKEEVDNYLTNQDFKSSIVQNHFGQGDNIAGNKTIIHRND